MVEKTNLSRSHKDAASAYAITILVTFPVGVRVQRRTKKVEWAQWRFGIAARSKHEPKRTLKFYSIAC